MSDKHSKQKDYMQMALAEAEKAATAGEVPVGAVLVAADGTVLAAMGNLDAAEQILPEGRDTLLARLGPDHPRVRHAETKLTELRALRCSLDLDLILRELQVITFAQITKT